MRNHSNNRRSVSALKAQIAEVRKNTESRCFRASAPANPPSVVNSGDAWHHRKVACTSLADTNGDSILTAGAILRALSPNSANVPIRLEKITAYALGGTAGTYPPTFLQVNFSNEEFCQASSAVASVRDSLTDGGGQGAGPPVVSLFVPDSLRFARADWNLSTLTTIATAASLPSGARVLWQVTLQFKF
jgi:hypothetical protein